MNDDGTFRLTDKSTGIVYQNVAAFEDVADVGDEYNYCPPTNDRRVTNSDARLVSARVLTHGPLRTTLRVELEVPLPASASSNRDERSTEIVTVPMTIDAVVDMESPRVGFSVSVDNRARDHRLRLLFPTGAFSVDSARADSAFDVVSRPARQAVPAVIKNEAPVSSAPMISFVSAGDDRAAATVIGRGLMEYEILDSEPTIAVTLLRAVGDLSRGDLATRPSGQAGPPVPTPGAQCIGRHTFELAFQPHGAPPPNGALFAAARAHNLEPRVVIARLGNGDAPLRRSFVRIAASAANATLVLSAIKQAERRPTTIARLFNPADAVADAVLSFDVPIAGAFAVNFLEERQRELTVADDGIVVQLRPREIQTIEVLAE